ncbi:MAG: ABC transporter substrate-binding protein [Planctomycetota bacterium]
MTDKSSRYAVMLAIAVALLASCSRETPATDPDELRIISFMPSATRIVVDLGLGDRIVGVAEHDAAAPSINADGEPMPIVGHFMDVDIERLLSLRPTHVIFPETTSGVPAPLESQLDLRGAALLAEPYPTVVADVYAAIVRLADGLGQPESGQDLLNGFESRMMLAGMFGAFASGIDERFGLDAAAGDGIRTRALLAFAVDPVVASGPGSINHELLTMAGGLNVVGDASTSAVTLDREAVIGLNPAVVVLLLPGRTAEEAFETIAWFEGLPIDAIKRGRVYALTDPQVLLPATNLPEVLRQLSGVIVGDSPRVVAPNDDAEQATPVQATGETGESVER